MKYFSYFSSFNLAFLFILTFLQLPASLFSFLSPFWLSLWTDLTEVSSPVAYNYCTSFKVIFFFTIFQLPSFPLHWLTSKITLWPENSNFKVPDTSRFILPTLVVKPSWVMPHYPLSFLSSFSFQGARFSCNVLKWPWAIFVQALWRSFIFFKHWLLFH